MRASLGGRTALAGTVLVVSMASEAHRELYGGKRLGLGSGGEKGRQQQHRQNLSGKFEMAYLDQK